MHLLGFVGVQEQHVVALEADEVQGGAGAAAHDADAVGPRQHRLQLRHVARVHLHMAQQEPASGLLHCALLAGHTTQHVPNSNSFRTAAQSCRAETAGSRGRSAAQVRC